MRHLLTLACLLLFSPLTHAESVLIRTDKGDIEAELDPRAPATVANFLRYVDARAYDGGKFYRTVRADNQPDNKVKIAVIQAGLSPNAEEFAPIKLERTSVTRVKHIDGALSMARDGPDTATAEFFICVGDQPELDHGGKRNPDGQGFAAFGRVVRGMDVVKAINAAKADKQALAPPIAIREVRRLKTPTLVAHRGLLRHAPENTLSAFESCLNLRLGFELDVRRSKDGHLVLVHDDTLARTTDGEGKVGEKDLKYLKSLDAGRWFDPAFAGQRIPTLDEVFALVKAHGHPNSLVALDLKVDDVEADVVKLANKHGILSRMVCIGTAIDSPTVRKRLRDADAKTPVACLAQTADDLPKSLTAKDADWAYVRFVPTLAQVQQARKAGRKVIVVGKAVAGREEANWDAARYAGVDAILTDYPLDCRLLWRGKK